MEHAPVRQDVQKCNGCSGPIIFVKTAASVKAGKEKWIPLDAKPERRMVINSEQLAESVTVWMPHHATCEKVEDFR